MTIRIAMWSGPRNISTAMMRAWENRPDCAVIDEPFYACYLAETGLEHPCRQEILVSQPTQRSKVVEGLTKDCPAPIFYQKHMTHHMPVGFTLDWSVEFRHAFLIRDPAAVIASYLKKMPTVTSDDIGIVRQWELFDEVCQLQGRAPPVIDGADVLQNPVASLERLCVALGVSWSGEAMTQWPAGPRTSDGVWAPHWYQNVWQSTGFTGGGDATATLLDAAQSLADAMRPYYEKLRGFSLL